MTGEREREREREREVGKKARANKWKKGNKEIATSEKGEASETKRMRARSSASDESGRREEREKVGSLGREKERENTKEGSAPYWLPAVPRHATHACRPASAFARCSRYAIR